MKRILSDPETKDTMFEGIMTEVESMNYDEALNLIREMLKLYPSEKSAKELLLQLIRETKN